MQEAATDTSMPDKVEFPVRWHEDVEELDEKMARGLLDRLGHRQRGLKSDSILAWALEMLDNRWIMDGGRLLVAPSGEFFDGQNRMMALLRANDIARKEGREPVTAPFTITWGADPRAKYVVDTNNRRTLADTLQIARGPVPQVVATAATINASWRLRNGLATTKRTPHRDEALTFYDANRLELWTAIKAVSNVRILHYPLSLAAALYMEFDLLDHDANEEFWVQFVAPRSLPETHPLWMLHQIMDRDRRSHPRMLPGQRFARTIKAWNAWREGVEPNDLRWRVSGPAPEPFPEPV